MARQSGTTRTRQAKIAAIREQETRRRRRMIVAVSAIATVVVVVVALLIAKSMTSTSPTGSGAASSSASSEVISGVTGVPGKVFDQVGTGAAQLPPRPLKGPPLTEGGKPRVLYAGAEYCPYCAAERWAVVAALSRFGTFSNLGQTHSSSQDVYPSTPTLSFHGASYSSRYLAFKGYEMQSNKRVGSSYAPLDTLSPADKKVFATYDAPPYVPSQSAGSIPFIDLGGRYMISGASYNPAVLGGKTHLQIARALSNPGSPIAKSVDGTANLISAALCQQTGNQPASVCKSPGVTAASKVLPGS